MVAQVKTKMAPEITSEAFESLLKFVYYGESAIPPLHAVELITFSFEYGMLELNKLCYEIISKNINNKTAISILGVTYLEISPLEVLTSDLKDMVKTIKRSAIFYIHNNIKQIDLRPLKKMNPYLAVDVVLANQPEALDEEPEPVLVTPTGTLKGKSVDKSKSKQDLNVPAVVAKSPEPKKEEPKKDAAATPDPKTPNTPKKEEPKKGEVKKEFSASKTEIGKRDSPREEVVSPPPKKEEPKREEPKEVEDIDDDKKEKKEKKKEKKEKKEKKKD